VSAALYYTDRGDGRAKLKTPQGNVIDVADLDAIVEVVKAARVLVEACEGENEYEGRTAPSDSILGQARKALANLDREVPA
jgi:hypothetical protein